MEIGVPREVKIQEYRVGLAPWAVQRFVEIGPRRSSRKSSLAHDAPVDGRSADEGTPMRDDNRLLREHRGAPGRNRSKRPLATHRRRRSRLSIERGLESAAAARGGPSWPWRGFLASIVSANAPPARPAGFAQQTSSTPQWGRVSAKPRCGTSP
jgi:hypothetical protein